MFKRITKSILGLKSTALALLVSQFLCLDAISHEKQRSLTNPIIKSQFDSSQYRHLTLDNGLRVLLIEEPKALLAITSLSVNAGYYQDPEHTPGIAHLLEHVLSKGSLQYPGASAYKDYLNKHGGKSNASTSNNITNYYFSINPTAIEGGLRRFAAQFISPSLEDIYIYKERNAVDSEFQMKFNDHYRQRREIMRLSVDSKHPYRKFSTGNLGTLKDASSQKLSTSIRTFFEKYYSASNMTLVTMSSFTLDKQEQLIREIFSKINSNQSIVTRPHSTPDAETLVPRTNTPYLYLIKPRSNKKSLLLNFLVPSSLNNEFQGISNYFSWLLSSEHQGGLANYLQNQALATKVSASSAYLDNRFDFFNIDIKLTKSGLKKAEKVISAVYDYLNQIANSGLSQAQYQIYQQVSQAKFDQDVRPYSSSRIRSISKRMLNTTSAKLLTTFNIPSEYDRKNLVKYLSYLQRENLTVFFSSKTHQPKNIEPIYHTPYDKLKLNWTQNPTKFKFTLPTRSPYITKKKTKPNLTHALEASLPDHQDFSNGKLSIQYIAPRINKSPFKGLAMFINTKALEKDGDSTEEPKLKNSMNTPSILMSTESITRTELQRARQYILNQLYVSLLKDRLSSIITLGESALIEIDISTTTNGMLVKIQTSSGNLTKIATDIIDEVFSSNFKKESFLPAIKKLKAKYSKDESSRLKEEALRILLEELSFVPEKPALYTSAKSLGISEFKEFNNNYLDTASVKLILYGALSNSDLMHINASIENNVKKSKSLIFKRKRGSYQPKTSQPKQVEKIKKIKKALNESAIRLAYFPTQTIENKAKTKLLGAIIKAPFFHKLRTQQQIGYSVSAGSKILKNRTYLNYYIQSSLHSLATLKSKVERFNQSLLNLVNNLSESEFNQIKYGLTLSEKLKRINAESDFQFEINRYKYMEDKDSQSLLIKSLMKLTKEDIASFTSQILDNNHTSQVLIGIEGKTE